MVFIGRGRSNPNEKFSKKENSQHVTRTRNSQKRENVKFCKIQKQQTKIRKTRNAQKAVKCGNNKRKAGKNKNKIEQNQWNKSIQKLVKRHVIACPFGNAFNECNNSQATCKADNSWLC